jgi:hypothetical protein
MSIDETINNILNKTKRAVAITVMSTMGILGIGCGDDNGGDRTGPTQTNVVAEDSYEGSYTVSVDATDESGVASIEFHYKATGSIDAYAAVVLTNTSGNTWSADIDFNPDEFEYKFVARDTKGNVSEVTGIVRKYAEEPREDEELPAKLASYAEVLDYGVNDPNGIDIGGSFIYPDYWALIENPSFPGDPVYGSFVVGWYQGPGDDDHTAEKALCDDYFVPWAQINACPQDEIGPKLDEIRAAGWENSGQVKSAKTLEEFF